MSDSGHIRSLPALALSLRQTDRQGLPASTAEELAALDLVTLYQVDGGDLEKEIHSATYSVGRIADKLRRLGHAYGEWSDFEPSAFFDLYPEQVHLLLSISERVNTVHVTFYADLLLPSFRRAERYWATEFFPAYQSGRPADRLRSDDNSYAIHYHQIAQPKMVAYWQRVTEVARGVRAALSDDITFLAATGGADERAYWQRLWPRQAPAGLVPELLPAVAQVPTVTLSVSFPLPAHRQPGRLRRLRQMWRRKSWRHRSQ